MRATDRGLHKGTQIRVVGAGIRYRGRIASEPEPGSDRISFWSAYSGGLYTVPLAKVKVMRHC